MLNAADIRGVYSMPPTPCKPGAEGWDVADSVDLDAAARMVDKLIEAGISGLALNGTTGECAALLWEEKRDYVDTVIQVGRKRVPIFAGCTGLGTKETIRQMRGMKEIGADGAFVGLPLWQTPTIENSVRFYADLGEAMPDMPVMVYGNPMYFKSTFPTIFWEQVAQRAKTVITGKYGGVANLLEDLRVAGHQITFLPSAEGSTLYAAYKMCRPQIKACWSTSAPMGPEPLVAFMEAIDQDDQRRVDEIWEDLRSVPGSFPPQEAGLFPQYNAQVVKWRVNAAGFVNVGPARAPYRELPEHWQRQAELNAKAWAEVRKKYVKVPSS